MTLRDDLATPGIWYFTDGMSAAEAADVAGWIESLGYSTFWLPDTIGRDPFPHIVFEVFHINDSRFPTEQLRP